MTRRWVPALLLAMATGVAWPATAAAQQTLNVTVGGFVVRGEDARVGAGCGSCGRDADVLVANRSFFAFDVADFNAPTVGAEWLIPLGNFVEAGAGVSFSRRTVPSVYADFVDNDGSEVEQDLRLRMVPLAFTMRVLPLGQTSPVQPYFGAGLALVNWRYSESGEFIDFSAGREIFRDTFVADGTARGPVALGGLRFAGDAFSAGGEIRYQKAEGTVGSSFAADKIDLGGWTYQATIGFRFGR